MSVRLGFLIALLAFASCTRPQPENAKAGVIERIKTYGNTYTRAKTIRSALAIREGEPFTPADLDAARRQLEALGLRHVTISTRPGSSSRLVVVDVHVTERPRKHAGFSSRDAFITGPGLSQTPPE